MHMHFLHIGYKYELALVLNGIAPIPDLATLEQQMVQSLHQGMTPSSSTSQTPKKMDSTSKSHFIYLLLDSRKADQMQVAKQQEQQRSCFRAFVESVFYVGKGKNARSLQHLKDAKISMQTNNMVRLVCLISSYLLHGFISVLNSFCLLTHIPQSSDKIQSILDIWSSGRGVMSLHLFNNITAAEAFTREACIIDAIGKSFMF